MTEAASRRRRIVIVAGHSNDAPTALAHLNDPDPKVVDAALGALQRLGQLTATQLDDTIEHPSVIVRRRVATMTAEVPCSRQLELLRDEDSSVIEIAAWACGERPHDAGAVAQLIQIGQGHDDPLCREAAIAALGALGDPAGLPTILAGCQDKPAIRRRAVLCLAPFEGPEVDAALAAALEDRDWQTRQSAEDLVGTARPESTSGD